MHGNLTELPAAELQSSTRLLAWSSPFPKARELLPYSLVLRASPNSVCQPPVGVRGALG